MPRLYDELRSIIDVLDRNGIDYALCGGIAMAVHGRPRTTVAIDIMISEASKRTWKAGNYQSFPGERLIALKKIAGRPQDIADIAALREG